MHRRVRALSRGMAIVRDLSAWGPSSVIDIAQRTGINRTTSYRLLETLGEDNYVVYDQDSGLFSLTSSVRQLSDGLSLRDRLSQAAVPPMFDLLKKINWPSDFAVFDRGSVLIRESTHSYSPFSIHRSMIGRHRSLFRSALGKSILSVANNDVLRDIIDLARVTGSEAQLASDDRFIARLIERVQLDGYASSVGETESNISAIALPVKLDEKTFGALNVVFFGKAMSVDEAANRYLEPLRCAVDEIERRAKGQA